MRLKSFDLANILSLRAIAVRQGLVRLLLNRLSRAADPAKLDVLDALKPKKRNTAGRQSGRYLVLGLSLASFWLSGLDPASADESLSAGMPAPAFELANLLDDGERLALKDFSGQVVYLDFWASWCGPCLVAMPKIDALQQTVNSDDFIVLAINVDRDLKKARKFLTKIGVGYPSLVDEDGRIAGAYGLNAMPSSFVINRAGIITKIHEGFRDGDESDLLAHIKRVIDDGA